MNNLKNYGFLPPLESPKDYIFGGVSGIVHEDRLISGDWRPYVPVGELQRYKLFDDFGCTQHSTENSLEIQGRFLDSSKLLRSDDIWWLKENLYVDKDGNWNFDDRWLTIEAGNVPGKGNYMNKPWDTLHNKGLPPQGAVPFRDNMTQSEYYDKSDFPQSSYALALEFKDRFRVQYERVTALDDKSLRKALKHAPIQVGVATCGGWFGEGVVHSCVAEANHACLLVHLEDDGTRWVFDSYQPFLKKLAPGYPIQFAYKGVLSPVVNVLGKKKENYKFNNNLKFGDYNNDVTQLSKRLIEENCLDTRYSPTPHYGVEVKEAVFEYQKRNSIISWLDLLWYRGKYFGPRTRAHINK